MKNRLEVKGTFELVHKDKDGKVLSTESVENLVTNEGFDYILDASLNASTAVATWYFAPYGTAFTAAVGSTYAVPGGTELTTYDEANRQEWDEGASSSQSVTNAAAATITADASGLAILGIGICGAPVAGTSSTKGNTDTSGGILLAEVAAVKTLADGETLDMTYTLSKT